MKILKARLYEQEMEKKAEEMDALYKSKKDIAWEARSALMSSSHTGLPRTTGQTSSPGM